MPRISRHGSRNICDLQSFTGVFRPYDMKNGPPEENPATACCHSLLRPRKTLPTLFLRQVCFPGTRILSDPPGQVGPPHGHSIHGKCPGSRRMVAPSGSPISWQMKKGRILRRHQPPLTGGLLCGHPRPRRSACAKRFPHSSAEKRAAFAERRLRTGLPYIPRHSSAAVCGEGNHRLAAEVMPERKFLTGGTI